MASALLVDIDRKPAVDGGVQVSVLALDRDPELSVATSAARVDTLAVTIARTRDQFDALEAEWSALFDQAATGLQMFQSFNWLWHWTRHYFEPETTLAIVTARRRGRLVFVLPLMIERLSGVRVLCAMGDPVGQYLDAVIAPEENAAALVARAFDALDAAGGFDVVRLAKVRADSHLDAVLRARGFTVTAVEEAPFATIKGHASFEAFEARLSTKVRSDRRRRLRRLQERGPLEVVAMSGTPEAAEAVRTTIRLKRDWLQRRGLFSRAFMDRRFDAFFATAVASTERPAGVSVSVLRSNGLAAGVTISVTAKERIGLHILAYDQAVEKLGVGNQHLESALRRAFDQGIEVYDFLAPKHPYKMEWADGVVAVNDWARAQTWRGAIYLHVYVAGVREGAKWLMRVLPKPVAQRLARIMRAPAGDAES